MSRNLAALLPSLSLSHTSTPPSDHFPNRRVRSCTLFQASAGRHSLFAFQAVAYRLSRLFKDDNVIRRHRWTATHAAETCETPRSKINTTIHAALDPPLPPVGGVARGRPAGLRDKSSFAVDGLEAAPVRSRDDAVDTEAPVACTASRRLRAGEGLHRVRPVSLLVGEQATIRPRRTVLPRLGRQQRDRRHGPVVVYECQ